MTMLQKTLYFTFASLVFIGCTNTTPKKSPIYAGYGFDAMINDALVVKLKDASKIPALQRYHNHIIWQTNKPIHGSLSSKYRDNNHTNYLIGKIRNQEPLQIIPLQQVKVKTYKSTQTSQDVFIGGNPIMSSVNVLKKNTLPSGEYIFRMKIHGTKNWDRKEIYVRVK